MPKKNIRAVQVAKHLGISSSDLRKYLSQVNFGVKPTDREFPEAIANGIVRFVSRKLGKKVPSLINLELEDDLVSDEEDEALSEEEELSPKSDSVSELEKLSQIAKKSRENSIKSASQSTEDPTDKKSTAPIFRKIEIAPEDAQKAKQKMQEELERKSKKEKEEEKLEQKVFSQAQKKHKVVLKKKEGVVEIPEAITVKEFSEKIGIPVSDILKELLKNGIMANINKTIDYDTAAIIADSLEVQLKQAELTASSEDLFAQNLRNIIADEQENLQTRPPVIAVMGHVDHGKTKILDAIRNTKVADGEAGGITQHIGAYQVVKNNKKITFLDTPGHEAFTAMRARGAKTADVAILVVAADEGIKAQTIEAINHAKEAEIPIVVAINKIDRENANIDKVKGELANQGLNPEDWGGDTICVGTSALQGQGIDELLEVVLLSADMQELKANPNRQAVGTVIEAHLDESLGPVATILVNTGTLKIGDEFLIAQDPGRVKTMINDEGVKLKQADPATPVRISGLSIVPSAGDILQSFKSKKILKARLDELRDLTLEHNKGSGLGVSEIMDQLKQGKMKFLKVVLKADTDGSLEAVKQAIDKIKHEEVGVKVIHAAVGSVTETDVVMAAASQGVVFGFNVRLSPRVKRIAEHEGVEVRNFKIIFELTDMLKKILEGLLEPEYEEVVTGEAEVKQIFWTKGKTRIIGCKVNKGYLENGEKLKVLRADEEIGQGKIAVLQHFEKKVPKIEENQECGIQLEGLKEEIQEGDILHGVKEEKKIKTL